MQAGDKEYLLRHQSTDSYFPVTVSSAGKLYHIRARLPVAWQTCAFFQRGPDGVEKKVHECLNDMPFAAIALFLTRLSTSLGFLCLFLCIFFLSCAFGLLAAAE
jgi:hypothetical protein